MPTITVFPDVPRAYNRVEVNWSDTATVTHARVLRVDAETGQCTPLRPYICYDGDYLLLSCGHGIFWDTEVPLDRSVYYITEGVDAPCIPTSPIVFDDYTRNLVDSWGAMNTGQVYTLSGGTNPGDYDVNGSQGTHTMSSVNVRRHSFITTTNGDTDQNIYVDTFLPFAVPTGASTTQWLLGRVTDVNNWYSARLELTTANQLNLVVCKRVASLVTDLAGPTNIGTGHIPNEGWTIRLNITGSTIRAKAWRTSSSSGEPQAWQVTATDTDLTTGTGIGVATRLEPGSGDTGIISAFDNLYLGEPCSPCEPVTAETEPSTMPSNGAFRLKDPVRPCNDIYMPLCFDQSSLAEVNGQYCTPGSGVFFASMETESYDSNTLTVNPTNARRPLAMSRARRDVSSNLTVVTRTFTDRDNLLRLVGPGSPILLQGPPQYGIPDRYMDIGTVGIDRGLTDHKFQVRIAQMPHVAVDRPAGPQNGVCGSRVADLCDFTFNDLADGGNTWEDLVRGRPTGALGNVRTWDDVLTEFADWNAVDNGTRDWVDVEQGN